MIKENSHHTRDMLFGLNHKVILASMGALVSLPDV